MNTTEDQKLTTADFAAAAGQRERGPEEHFAAEGDPARPAPGDGAEPIQVETHQRADRHPDQRLQEHRGPGMQRQDERLAPLFLPQMAQKFKEQWDEVQIGFVDDPAQAVRRADELVAQVMKNLAETFADERANVESQMDQGDTELMRVALRRYRSFFQRLLSL
ncbi:MAG TPA: hypothetical protein VGE20_20315 [Ramlibacter sp.]